MKLEFEVDSYMLIPKNASQMIDKTNGMMKQYMFHVPICYGEDINAEYTSELSITFKDGHESLYKWDKQKSEWVKQMGHGLKTLKFPTPIRKGQI